MFEDYVEQATTFDGCDAPDGMRHDGFESYHNHYNRLSKVNSLRWNGEWRDEPVATEQDNHAIVGAVAGQLELTPYQKARSHEILDSLPTETLVGNQSSLLALCICGIVGREDGRDYHPNNAHPNSDKSTPFVDIYETLDVSYSELYSCWNRLLGLI